MGVSLLLVAVGAILVWAVNATVSGIEVHTIGWILLIVGAVGALFSLIFWSSWGGFGGPAEGRRRVVREDYYGATTISFASRAPLRRGSRFKGRRSGRAASR
jgi:hypothetical protein